MTVTVDQLRNLADRAGSGLTPDEQQRLRDGIDALHTERADAWQKFATVAAQRDRLRIRMNNLADRWEHALGVDKPYARTLRAEISIEPFRADDDSPEAALATPPADGTRPARHVHVTITNPDPYTANRAALSLADFIAAEFPGHHVTTDAREWDEPGPG